MTRSRLIVGLASVFAGLAAVMVILASIYRTPVPLFVAAPFGVTAYLMWHHGTGTGFAFAGRSRRERGRRRAGPGRPSSGFGRADRSRADRRNVDGHPMGPEPGMSAGAAYRILGLDPGADQESIRRAYRERAKEVHPDAAEGDPRSFKRLTRAYDRLRE